MRDNADSVHRGPTGGAIFRAVLLLAALLAPPENGIAATAPVSLGTADSFAVLAGSAITNTGPTRIIGDVGIHPGTAVSGFGSVTLSGTLHVADGVALQAKSDLVVAYEDAAGRTPATTIATELGGQTLVDGVYTSASGTFEVTGTLTLDGQGDPNAVFILQMASSLTTASASVVNLINGAQSCNVFWQVGSSATLGTGSTFRGNILALTSITVTTGTTVDGRTLARNGAVTLDTDVIARTICPPPDGTGGGIVAPDVTGGEFSNHVLVPWFEVNADQGLPTSENVLVVVTNLRNDAQGLNGPFLAGFIHARIFDADSLEACNLCRPVTAEDVLVESMHSLIDQGCGAQGFSLLDPAGDGTWRGYATFELHADAQCTVEVVDDDALIGQAYKVQLNQGLASGINTPGYSSLGTAGLADSFLLLPAEKLFFRFLVALDGDPSRAQTQIVVWSARSDRCAPGVPDSACLQGTQGGSLRVCDEEENCTSQGPLTLDREVNVFTADERVPGNFATGGGFFMLENGAALPLSVLGYSDNRATSPDAGLSWNAIFAAQRQ